MSTPEVAVFTSRRCLAHRAPGGYPETPARLSGILDRLSAARWEVGGGEVTPEIFDVEGAIPELGGAAGGEPVAKEMAEAMAAVTALHDPEYVERFRAAAERGDGLLDSADNPLSPGTWPAAWAAVSAALAAAAWLDAGPPAGAAGAPAVAGEASRLAFAAVRPPGHHAERDHAMGFCFFNNAAVAAHRLAVGSGGSGGSGRSRRVAVFDFDVHHGNGTQHLFAARADILFASTHQFPFYPGTGAASEVGEGAGRGATLNVPLAAGTGGAEFLEVVAERIEPALRAHRPEVLVLSAGFDAWRGDPLGGLAFDHETYHELGVRLGRLAAELGGLGGGDEDGGSGGGRVLALLEGGYDLAALPELVETHLSGLVAGLAMGGDGTAAEQSID